MSTNDDPKDDPVGTVRVFPRWQDAYHDRNFAIKWALPLNKDEPYPWAILGCESDSLQRLSNYSLEGCKRIPLSSVAKELGHPDCAEKQEAALPIDQYKQVTTALGIPNDTPWPAVINIIKQLMTDAKIG